MSLGYTNFWTGNFALVTSILDFLLAAVTYFCIDTKRFGRTQTKGAAGVLVVMWSLSILLLTFDLDVEAEYYDINGSTPLLESTYHMSGFTTGGNGFIATWAGTLCAFKFAYNEFVGGTLNLTGIVRNSISLRYQETTMQPADV